MTIERSIETALFLIVRYSAISLPLIALAGTLVGGWWTYSAFLIVFGFYFFVELILMVSGLRATVTTATEFDFAKLENSSFFDSYALHFYSIGMTILVPTVVLLLTSRPMDVFFWGSILSTAVTVGTVGGLVGHEFIHRSSQIEKYMGILTYSMINYGHFKVSHLLGHHVSVGQNHDWSTARKNESYYHFWFRAIFHGYFGAWRLESQRLKTKNLSFWSHHNNMLWITLLQVTLWVLFFSITGLIGLLIWVLISFLAISLMEMVNYLSHYGLVRVKKPNGRLEGIKNLHSWESNNKVTNWFIFNAGKHCHHHTRPNAKHHELKLAYEKDFLPYGLPLMSLIALLPPLYLSIMNSMLSKNQKIINQGVVRIGHNADLSQAELEYNYE